jgi:hypothetical protein
MIPALTIALQSTGSRVACVAQVQTTFSNGTAVSGASISISWSSSPTLFGFARIVSGKTDVSGAFSARSDHAPKSGVFVCIATIALRLTDSMGDYTTSPGAMLSAMGVVR